MAIYQTNIYICGVCGKIESTTKEVELHDDPIVDDQPNGEARGYIPGCGSACSGCFEKKQDVKEYAEQIYEGHPWVNQPFFHLLK